MTTEFLLAFVTYIAALLLIGFLSYRRSKNATDFILAGRSLNFWVTALSAHASDMSSWLFMAYPATVFVSGGVSIWAAIGLVVGMFCAWQFIAPRLRTETERYGSLTLSSYFNSRLGDHGGALRLIGALLSLLFFTVYVSAGLVGIGYLVEGVIGVDRLWGMGVGIVVVTLYTLVGGFASICWVDFFQALFLLIVIVTVPIVALAHVGGASEVATASEASGLSMSLWPEGGSIWQVLLLAFGWGLGYFGQTHILTKFMGIKHPRELRKSKWVGITWQIICLLAATLVGVVGIAFFKNGLANPELVFVLMVKALFHPYVAGLVLCGVLAATISTMDSQILVLVSVLSEDLYHRFVRRKASDREGLWTTRISCLAVAIGAFLIAVSTGQNVLGLVFYSWSGLGSTFGPVLVLALYSRRLTWYGALVGMLFGGCVAAAWPWINAALPMDIPALIPGFLVNLGLIYIVSLATCVRIGESHNG